MEACLDANIFVAVLDVREPRHQESLELLEYMEARDVVMMEPAIVGFEVTSVLSRKSMRGDLSAEGAADLIDYFSKLPLLLQWQPPLLRRSSALARQLSLGTAYDCSYLAVAEARDIPFITLDTAFARKAKRVYERILEPFEYLRKALK
jgi:predicted nucleic acid-binding protein